MVSGRLSTPLAPSQAEEMRCTLHPDRVHERPNGVRRRALPGVHAPVLGCRSSLRSAVKMHAFTEFLASFEMEMIYLSRPSVVVHDAAPTLSRKGEHFCPSDGSAQRVYESMLRDFQ